ncbi:MAG: hypothetical protein IJR46_01390 [Neisseriaceae bacterium]|nr:hypothetical protein [Neisseriaceae bacterium]
MTVFFFRLPEMLSLFFVVRRLPRRFTARNDGYFWRLPRFALQGLQ